MDILAQNICYLTAGLSLCWIVMTTLQYHSLGKDINFIFAFLSLFGLVGFAFSQCFYSLFQWFPAKLYAHGSLSLMLAMQVMLLVWNLEEVKTKKKLSVLIKLAIIIVLFNILSYQRLGMNLALLQLVILSGVGLTFLYSHRNYFRLHFRFQFFHFCALVISYGFSLIYKRIIIWDILESVFFLISLVFYYQTITFMLAAVYCQKRVEQ